MQNQWKARKPFLNRLQALEVQALVSGKLIGAVACPDGNSQTVAVRSVHEFLSLRRLGEYRVFRLDRHFIFDALQLAKFGFDSNSASVRVFDDSGGRLDILLEGKVGRIDHHRTK